MLRSILGAVLGYVAIVVVVIAGLFLTWQVLGAAGSFSGEGPYPSTAWIGSALVFGLLAAFVGGKVALKVGRGPLAPKILIGLILVLGTFAALTAESAYEKRVANVAAEKPVADLTFAEAGQVARNPSWYNWVIPLVGAAGACLGGLRRSDD